jgi:hypothetical protein
VHFIIATCFLKDSGTSYDTPFPLDSTKYPDHYFPTNDTPIKGLRFVFIYLFSVYLMTLPVAQLLNDRIINEK